MVLDKAVGGPVARFPEASNRACRHSLGAAPLARIKHVVAHHRGPLKKKLVAPCRTVIEAPIRFTSRDFRRDRCQHVGCSAGAGRFHVLQWPQPLPPARKPRKFAPARTGPASEQPAVETQFLSPTASRSLAVVSATASRRRRAVVHRASASERRIRIRVFSSIPAPAVRRYSRAISRLGRGWRSIPLLAHSILALLRPESNPWYVLRLLGPANGDGKGRYPPAVPGDVPEDADSCC